MIQPTQEFTENQFGKADFDVGALLKTLTERPGVYRMSDAAGQVIYIGKAKNLKKRVSSHFRANGTTPKQQAMRDHVCAVEVTVTHTEGEALLLESQLIKRYKPRYNICLRDDKSYPYIFVTTHQSFPRVTFHRGARKQQGHYFGPYPSAGAVRESLKTLQKIFPVRQCEDSYFKNRSRPCLQYQIERCTAPCVELVDAAEYRQDVDHTMMFLEGKGTLLIDELVKRMEAAADNLHFETAARYRDRIAALRTVLDKQFVHGERGDVDIVACASNGGVACVQVVSIRKGQQLGGKAFFPKMPEDREPGHVLEAFVPQYYLDKPMPNEILLSHELTDVKMVEAALADRANHPVLVSTRLRGERLRWLKLAQMNADDALKTRLSNRQSLFNRFLSLQEELGCGELPRRLECFDISHTQGDKTVASCVVFDQEGAVKSAYRRFNVEGITAGDDYAALAQAVSRRFKRLQKEAQAKPDILFIDGGKGQVSVVDKALKAMDVDDVMIVGVAKGPDRKPGMETLFRAGDGQAIPITSNAPALLLVQQIRDEAHRFAITGHRQRRRRATKRSVLESIAGLGPKRRQSLIKQFGGLREVSKAGVDALSGVNGISRELAQRIYDTFHEQAE
jgi:excinuclease ABC subunit C